MKIHYLTALGSLLLIACSGADTTDDTVTDQNRDVSVLDDSTHLQGDEYETNQVFEAWAAVDGPDENLWITTPADYEGTEQAELPDFKVIQIIPEQKYSKAAEECEWMLGIIVNDFGFYGSYFEDFTGPVEVYYDGNKTKLLAKYRTADGKPDGSVRVYDPEGNLYLDWEYDQGEWVQARTSPFGADWTFDQGRSKLRILDEENAISYESGKKVVKLMQTFRSDLNEQNTLYTIMEKESFNQPFLVNGEVFSGVLRTFWLSASFNGNLYYELNFNDGWLDGDVKIYNDWGELELHELFVMGELDTTIYRLDYSEMDGVAKPIIYIYPEKEMVVDIDLHFDGELTHTYPKYSDHWKVLAKPDGTLFDESGKEFYALYWEGNARENFSLTEGFVVPKDETVPFLEKSLAIMGLNRREANEFIVYWLPKLEQNPYNLIHFSTDEYEQMARLNITPRPETLIRVMMVYKPLAAPIDIPLQDLNKIGKKRKGYTVVEWGGSLYKEVLVQ